MFDSGELATLLAGRSVEDVHSSESDTTEARKARLLQIFRLRTEKSYFRLAQNLARNLELDLRNTDLSGANLRDLGLRGIDLEGTDLTDADVTGTLFGDNPGLTEADKRDLERRGAVFQEPPNSDVPGDAPNALRPAPTAWDGPAARLGESESAEQN